MSTMVSKNENYLLVPQCWKELYREQMTCFDGNVDFVYNVGAGMTALLGDMGAIAVYLKTAPFWIAIAVKSWAFASSVFAAGLWVGAGIFATIGLLVAGLGLLGSICTIAYFRVKLAIHKFKLEV